MARVGVVLALAIAAAALALAAASPVSRRQLLEAAATAPKQAGTPPPTPNFVGDSAETCCRCKCVIPGKDFRSPDCKNTPGCVGMGAPSYSTKKICRSGFHASCDKVCVVDHGSWQGWHEC